MRAIAARLHSGAMRNLLISAAIALGVALAAAPRLPALVHPPLCSTVDTGGVVVNTFCISWDPDLGRYETPPAGVPADYGRPPYPPTIDPALLVVCIFFGATTLIWAALSLAGRYLGGRRKGHPKR